MRKILLVFLVNICFLSFLYGQSNEDDGGDVYDTSASDTPIEPDTEAESAGQNDEEYSAAAASSKLPLWMTSEGATLDTGRRESRKRFEIGVADIAISNVLNGVDLFSLLGGSDSDGGFNPEKMNSLSVDLDVFVNPLYAKFPINDTFTLDVFTGADVAVRMNLPEKTLKALKDIKNLAENQDISDLQNYVANLQKIDSGISAGAGVFVELGAGGAKTLMNGRLWVRVAPSLYFTMLYMKHSKISLKGYSNNNNEFGLEGEGAMHLYSAWDLDSGGSDNPFSSPGLDFTLEALYAVWPVLDAGLSVSHIPLIPSTLKHRMTIDGSGLSMYVDTNDPDSLMKFNMPDLDNMMSGGDGESKTVSRPARFDFYAFVKPFKSPVFIIRPCIGATVNTVFSDTALFNWGLKFQYNAPRIFSAFVSSGLTEGVWEQRVGISLDARAIELSLSAGLAGSSFAESWGGKGYAVAVGLKTGF
ncbi:MAG: hypothetical protein LBJ35_04185 [Spirochaetaceae bacterium]|jgi:hypothetical protein|nr:hypothetical protein [Spirochaetaceae bacterium]